MIKRSVSPVLWARVEDGAITYGPGPLPYRIEGYLVGHMTDEDIRSYGFQNVTVEYDDQFDPDVQSLLQPEVFLESDGTVVQKAVYEFQPSARQTMQEKIDSYCSELAGLKRIQMLEYPEVEKEARAIKNDSDPTESEYPLVATDIGVTKTKDGEVVTTLSEAATVILGEAADLRAKLASIRETRIKSKAQVREAATDDDAFTAYRQIVPVESAHPWT